MSFLAGATRATRQQAPPVAESRPPLSHDVTDAHGLLARYPEGVRPGRDRVPSSVQDPRGASPGVPAGGSGRHYRRAVDSELCIASWSVLEHREPVRLVVHFSDGTWLFTCGGAERPDELTTVHVDHLLDDPLQSLGAVRHLPPGQEAWRDDPSREWELAAADES